ELLSTVKTSSINEPLISFGKSAPSLPTKLATIPELAENTDMPVKIEAPDSIKVEPSNTLEAELLDPTKVPPSSSKAKVQRVKGNLKAFVHLFEGVTVPPRAT